MTNVELEAWSEKMSTEGGGLKSQILRFTQRDREGGRGEEKRRGQEEETRGGGEEERGRVGGRGVNLGGEMAVLTEGPANRVSQGTKGKKGAKEPL